jgi:hypothetical protein
MIRHAILAILGLALAACGDDKRSPIMGHGGVGREGQFTAAANSATYVGFTAGGGYFGHGVWCNPGGTKRIVVTDYHVE